MSKLFKSFVVLVVTFLGVTYEVNPPRDLSRVLIASNPAFDSKTRPLVLVDAAHRNLSTAHGAYYPFAELLRSDGYAVESLEVKFDKADLSEANILVIVNPMADEAWQAKPGRKEPPSAFSATEIRILIDWVEQGGSLLLIADHQPFAGAATELAKGFGAQFTDSFAVHKDRVLKRPPLIFCSESTGPFGDGLLTEHPVFRGRNEAERVTSVATFTGQAFTASGGSPLLVLGASIEACFPPNGVVTEETPRRPVPGWYQGWVKDVGKGRVALFGEARMFTVEGSRPTLVSGLTSKVATQNSQFLLNVMHWLSGLLEPRVKGF